MVRAVWNKHVIAESDPTVVEGSHYLSPESVRSEFLQPSDNTTYCGWKGTAKYYDVVVDGHTNPGAAWYYAEPLTAPNTSVAGLLFGKAFSSPSSYSTTRWSTATLQSPSVQWR